MPAAQPIEGLIGGHIARLTRSGASFCRQFNGARSADIISTIAAAGETAIAYAVVEGAARHAEDAKRQAEAVARDPSTVDRHRVRELIREWIVYPSSTRMREPRRPGAPPMSAMAAAPLLPRPRGNKREKRSHSLRSIADRRS